MKLNDLQNFANLTSGFPWSLQPVLHLFAYMAFIFLNSVYLKSFQLSVLNSVAAEIVVIQCENWAAGWLAVPAVEATLPSPTPSLYGAAINFS